MRKLVLGALLTSLMLAGSGCIISSDDDEDDGIGDGGDGGDGGGDFVDECGDSFVGILYQPSWVCPPDADSIAFTAFPSDGSGAIESEPIACGDVQPANICYDPGIYDIEALPLGDIGDFAPQFDSFDGVDGDLFEHDFVFSDVGGFFDVQWTVEGLDAADACNPGETIEVTATLASDPGKPFIDSDIPCDAGSAIVPADLDGWPLGEYTLDIALIDAGGKAISVPDPFSGVFIDFEGHLSPDVGTVDLLPK
jgi:hypothetical protein